MIYRKLGKTGLEVPGITFGAWAIGGWLWGGANKKDALYAIQQAVDLGITAIDTAAVYGFGESEKIVGEAVRSKRHQVQIFTKCGLRWDLENGNFYFRSEDNQGKEQKIYKFAGKESVIEECERSLKRLETDYIDLYQVHWPDDTTPQEDTMEALGILLQQGKIRAAGVSNYSKQLVEKANQYLPVASNQVPYSMIRKDIDKDVVPFCLENDISILAYSPLQRGLLTGKIHPGYHFNKGDNRPSNPYFQEPVLTRINTFLQEIGHIAGGRNVTMAQLVLNWTLYQPGITTVLAGARNPGQVKENAKASSFKLTPGETTEIDEKLEKLHSDLEKMIIT